MSESTFSLKQFNFGGDPEQYSSSMGFESQEGWNMGKHPHLHGNEIWGDFGCYVENTADDGLLWSEYQQEPQRQLFSNLGILDDLYVDIVSPPFQSYHHEELPELASAHNENSLLDEDMMENACAIPLSSLGILKNYGSGFRRLHGERIKVSSYSTTCTQPVPKVNGRKLSTDDIFRLAGKKFIQSSSQRIDGISALSHPFDTSFLGLSDEETKDVELVQNLLASAEKVGQQQYNRANKLLSQCDESSSDTGNPVQRVVYYFSEALREKIDWETGRSTSKGMGKQQLLDYDKALVSPNLAAIVAFRQKLPFYQVCEFSGMQAIVERVSGAKKVHLIDLEIRNGMRCTVLMQALAGRSECPIELLKITAVATKSKSKLEETGERLMDFANSMNIPFSFSVIMVSDMLDLKDDLFDLEAEETVAVNATCSLRSLLARPDRLETLMRVLRNINPCIVVVTETEANHNSPFFVNRFIEALFSYGAVFDCLEDCMDRSDPNRKISESTYISPAILNIVAAEGEERIFRHVNISVWRTFFARFGMVEEELSTSSLYQASMVVKNFSCGSSCSFHMDGKCLIIGWKGTPIHSLSAWKFR
ncbi:hypothetical protein Acr_24g0001020 [Actinidia rufa]|uniref:GRAS family transcription factor n=1 Tax=Actinidia rufa TaxID=165716 RepID=A0A7J0GT04_9ERIC|nr:hypothetical protein Acr_24g0001020 [Actinidia rufa]